MARLRRPARRAGFVLVVALLALVPSAGQAQDRPLSKPPVPAAGAYLGASASQHNGETRTQAIERTERQIGRRLAINHQFYKWDQALISQTQRDDAAAGRYPFVSWKPQRAGGQIVTWTSIAQGKEDAHIRAYARAARDFGHPMFATFHHEPYDESLDGRWGTVADFKAAFRRVVQIFREEGATNVAWVLVLTSWDYTQGRGDKFNPGADVVDWYAADPYNFFLRDGKWTSLAHVTQAFYDWGSRTGKPLMLAEWGTTEDPNDPNRKAAWFDEALTTLRNWPAIKAAVYFNNLHNYDWRIDTSPQSLDAFRRLANHPHFEPATAGAEAAGASDPLACQGGADGFTDVGSEDVLRGEVACAAAYGVLTGTSPATFEPDVPVTRAQAATSVANALEVVGRQQPAPAHRFPDARGDEHEAAIGALAAAGLVAGHDDGSFRPRAPVSRAQLATIVSGAHRLAVGRPLPPGDPSRFADVAGDVHAGSIGRVAAAGLMVGTSPTSFAPGGTASRAQLAAVLARLLRTAHLAGTTLVPLRTA